MPIEIPGWIQVQVGLDAEYQSRQALAEALSDAFSMLPVNSLTADELLRALTEDHPDIELHNARSVRDWRFVEISVGGQVECRIVELGEAWQAVPTNSVLVLAQAWVGGSTVNPFTWVRPNNGVLIAWDVRLPERKLSAELALAVAGIQVEEAFQAPELSLASASQIEVLPSSFALREKGVYGSLFQAALRQSSPGLRFLYLYRLFECAYLVKALDELQSDFFSDPKRAVDLISKVVANEKVALLGVVADSPSRVHFEQIERLFSENQTTLANRFMSAVHASASDDGDLNHRDAWKRGCILSYKVRCAIVHSGKSAPTFESFPDAATACLVLMPDLESATREFVGVKVLA